LIAFGIIGANLPDFDHKIKKDSVYKIVIIGLILFIILDLLNLPSFLGLIIVFFGLIFYFSNHRGFTHSIFGLLILTLIFSGFLYFSFELINNYFIFSDKSLVLIILILLIALFSLNRRIYLIFMVIFLISVFIFDISNFQNIEIIISFIIGYFSHIILDGFSPSGIKLFRPFSNKKSHKKFAISSLLILLVIGLFRLSLLYFNFKIIF